MSQTRQNYRPNPVPVQKTAALRPGGIKLSGIDYVRQNPIDVFARLALAEHYDAERLSAFELHISMPGYWCDHHITINWSPGDEIVQLFLVFDGRVPGGRTDDMCRLMTLINERLSVGHFDYWGRDDALVYRHAMSLAGEAKLSIEQAMAMLGSALEAAEKGYPACQYVMWAGKTPQDAIGQALLDKAERG